MKKIKAFTLAEVLITLGIIGIVAAMTIPNLVQSYKKKLYSTKLKHFYSMMSQAIKLSEIDNGPMQTWDKKPVAYDEEGNFDLEDEQRLAAEYFNRYLAPYIKYTKVENISNKLGIMVYLSDGTRMILENGACMDVRPILDNQEPVFGKNMFDFVICTPDFIDRNSYIKNNYFSAYCADCQKSPTREQLIDKCKTYGSHCAALFMYDNLEFKDDYPYKL